MAVELLTPFTMVNRRSAPKPAANDVLTGRWIALDTDGTVVAPGTKNVAGLYLCIEGSLGHKGTNLEFGNSGAGYASTKSFEYPSVKQSNECALAYGVFRYKVGPEGCDPAATFAVDDLITIDAYGRVVPATTGDETMGKVEAVATNDNGVTELTVRTFGK